MTGKLPLRATGFDLPVEGHSQFLLLPRTQTAGTNDDRATVAFLGQALFDLCRSSARHAAGRTCRATLSALRRAAGLPVPQQPACRPGCGREKRRIPSGKIPRHRQKVVWASQPIGLSTVPARDGNQVGRLLRLSNCPSSTFSRGSLARFCSCALRFPVSSLMPFGEFFDLT